MGLTLMKEGTEMDRMLILTRNNEVGNRIYIRADMVDYYEGDETLGTWIFTIGGHTIHVKESPEEINERFESINKSRNFSGGFPFEDIHCY